MVAIRCERQVRELAPYAGTSTMLYSASYFWSIAMEISVSCEDVILPERSSDCISRMDSIMIPSSVSGRSTFGRSNETSYGSVTEGGSLSTRVWPSPMSTLLR